MTPTNHADNQSETILPPTIDSRWLEQFLVPGLIAAQPYKIDTTVTPIKLDQNENPSDWPTDLKEKIAKKILAKSWNRYPSAYADEIADKIASMYGFGPGCVLIGPGSNYLITLAMSTFTRTEQGKVVVARPSFALYESHCAYDGIKYETWPLTEDLQYDITLLPELTPGSVVVFASPNNPVGNVLPAADLAFLAGRNPDTLFIADEAYLEYAKEPFTDLLAEHGNILLVRTFSKTLGAAGIRIGYLMGAPAIIAQLRKIRLPYMVNLFALTAADVVLNDAEVQQQFKSIVEKGISERDRVFTTLEPLQKSKFFRIIPSQANFLLIQWQSQKQCELAYRHLLNCGILVRDISKGPGLSGCFRVSIGTERQNNAFIEAFQSI